MKAMQEHKLLRVLGKHSQLKLSHQLIRLIWAVTWIVSTFLLLAYNRAGMNTPFGS